jgi:hypothetical protein
MLGGIGSWIFPTLLSVLDKSLYDRKPLEDLMREKVGERFIKEAMTDELLVVAYDYNSQSPRYYSKYFTNQ